VHLECRLQRHLVIQSQPTQESLVLMIHRQRHLNSGTRSPCALASKARRLRFFILPIGRNWNRGSNSSAGSR
jgi:hypothetical protein